MGCIKEADSSDYEATQVVDTDSTQTNQASAGDPVNVVTGAFTLTEHDIYIPSQRLVIDLTRHYNNQLHDPDEGTSFGGFGRGWSHSLELRLKPGPGLENISYYDDRGNCLIFTALLSEGFVSKDGFILRRTTEGGYLIERGAGTKKEFDSTGNYISKNEEKVKPSLMAGPGLLQITYFDKDNRKVIFDLPRINMAFKPPCGALAMQMVVENGGNFALKQLDGLTASFNPNGKIITLTRPGPKSDSHFFFVYDELGRLCRVKGAGERSLQFSYQGDDALIRSIFDHTGRCWSYRYNKNQELEEVYDPANRVRRYSYKGWKGLVATGKGKTEMRMVRALHKVYPWSMSKPSNEMQAELTNQYTTERRVFRQTDALGNITRFDYNFFTRITTVTDPLGWSTVYFFDANGNTTKIRKPGGGVIEYIFDNDSNLVAEIDPLGNCTEYADFKNPEILDNAKEFGLRALGNRSAYICINQDNLLTNYDNFGNRPLMRDPLGNTTYFRDYTSFGRPQKIILPDKSELIYQYDERSGLPTRVEQTINRGQAKPFRRIQEWAYDEIGNMVLHIEWAEREGVPLPSRKVIQFTYDAFAQPILRRAWIETNGQGEEFAAEEQYWWDKLGRKVSQIVNRKEAPNARSHQLVTSFAYDNINREKWKIDPEGNASCKVYDSAGRVVETFLVCNATPDILENVPNTLRLDRHQWQYDAMGYEIVSIDPAGAQTHKEYDQRGSCIAITDPLGFTTYFDYDRDGNQVLERTSTNYEIHTEYDKVGRPVRQTDNLGRDISRTYDANGKVTSISNGLGKSKATTDFVYDSLGRLQEIRYSDGTHTGYFYDERGNVINLIQGRGTKRIIQEYTYDELGRRTAIFVGTTEKMDLQFSISFNDSIREINVSDALGNTTRTYHDNLGLAIRKIDANGISSKVDYDNRLRVIHKLSQDGSVNAHYEYDAINRLKVALEGPITYEWQYDAAGRIVRHEQIIDQNRNSISYEYDAGGRLTKKQLGNKWQMGFEYDPSSPYLSRIVFPGANIKLQNDISGKIIEELWSSGSIVNYQYDSAGNLCGIKSSNKSDIVFEQHIERDTRGRPKKESRRLNGREKKYGFSYDDYNRLEQVSLLDAEGRLSEFRKYTYDDRGNRLEEYRDGSLFLKNNYDSANRLVESITSHAEREIREYDPCGNMIHWGDLVFSYDANQRLRSVQKNGKPEVSVEYQYSATDFRSICCNEGERQYTFYDGLQEIYVCKDNESVYSFWGPHLDSLLAIKTARNMLQRAITDNQGSVLAFEQDKTLQDYDPFGNIINGDSRPSIYGFCGKRFDQESDLYNSRARNYDPSSGRFIQPDPLGLVDGSNLYLYAKNNPLVYVDPTGWEAEYNSQGSLAQFEEAGKYGIQTYDDLRGMISGTRLEAHHLVEKRFADAIGMNPGSMASIALTPSEHRQITSAWRSEIGYNNQNTALTTATATRDDIWNAASRVYAGSPELLSAAYKDIFH